MHLTSRTRHTICDMGLPVQPISSYILIPQAKSRIALFPSPGHSRAAVSAHFARRGRQDTRVSGQIAFRKPLIPTRYHSSPFHTPCLLPFRRRIAVVRSSSNLVEFLQGCQPLRITTRNEIDGCSLEDELVVIKCLFVYKWLIRAAILNDGRQETALSRRRSGKKHTDGSD